jgi:hypothetical protein
MYEAYYPRSNKYYVYVNRAERVELIRDNTIESNDLEFIRQQARDFLESAANNSQYNQKTYLLEHINFLQREEARNAIIFTTGDFYLAQHSYPDYD